MQSYEERDDMLHSTFHIFNTLPNARPCTERDILRSKLFITSPYGIISNVEIRSENGSINYVKGFFFWDGSWIGMSGHWSDPHITWWMGAICEHDYEVHENHNTCQHSKTCKKCGYTETWGSD